MRKVAKRLYFTKRQWNKVKHMYDNVKVTDLVLGVIVTFKEAQ